jgi:GNAT superfamily N-acetyltransferase
MTQPISPQTDQLNLRSATAADVPQILAFIRDLAEYEREPDAVHATEADLLRDGFGSVKRFDCLIAELTVSSVTTAAGFALYFHNYSTWRGHSGIHVEDLYVRPEHRGKGIGKALLTRVAAIAVAEGCTRLQWDVLEWNTPAIGFYQQLGAQMLMDWRTMRVTGEALPALAAQDKSRDAKMSPDQGSV